MEVSLFPFTSLFLRIYFQTQEGVWDWKYLLIKKF